MREPRVAWSGPRCPVHGTPMRHEPDLCSWCEGSGIHWLEGGLWPGRCEECQGTGVPLSCEQCDEEAMEARDAAGEEP
jgi:DnaJ-class molecular chaperone